MLNININDSISIIERFFIERFLELIYKKTIDSYRHRLHNPKSLIKELLDTLNYVKIGKVRYDTHVPNIIKELTTIIEDENELIYKNIEKRYLKNILNSTKKDKYLKTIYVLQLLFDDNSNEKITFETKQKLKSAIRYLRLGNDALELEQKFISYWSGLESLFSNYNPDENNFARLSTIFPICHKIWYLKRNLIEFDRDIKRLGVTNVISNFSNTNISYLSKCEVYDEIITKFKTDKPLLAFRALSLKLIVENDKDRMKILENHSQNLQWNIARAYRIRNEIIHDAVINSEIVHITSHLKYYLIFILNSLLDFLSSSPIDINKDNKIDLDDFYTLQIIKSDNYEIKKYKVTDII